MNDSLTLKELLCRDDDSTAGLVRHVESTVLDRLRTIAARPDIPDIGRQVLDLFDLSVPPVLMDAWKKCAEILAAVKETEENRTSTVVVLSEHEVVVNTRPSIRVSWGRLPVLRINLDVSLRMTLRAVVLHIARGRIQRIDSGEIVPIVALAINDESVFTKELPTVSLLGGLDLMPYPNSDG